MTSAARRAPKEPCQAVELARRAQRSRDRRAPLPLRVKLVERCTSSTDHTVIPVTMRVPLRCQAEGRSAVPSEIKMRLHSGRKQRELTWHREHKTRDDQQDRKKKILTLLIPVTMRAPLRCEVDGGAPYHQKSRCAYLVEENKEK